MLSPGQRAFVYLSLHAKIHEHLNTFDHRHRTKLSQSNEFESKEAIVGQHEIFSAREEIRSIQFLDE